MARNHRKKKKKFGFGIKNTILGVLTALGITGSTFVGYELYENGLKEQNKQLEQDAKDLEKEIVLKEPIEEKEVEPTIEEDEIKDSIDEEISVEEEKVEDLEEEIEEVLEEEETENSINRTIYTDELIIPIIKNFDTVSIVDALNEVGYDSSKASRARLAVYFNIVSNEKEYRGSSEQNTLLLQCLREYALDYQVATHNDYAKVVDNKTIENSTTGNYNNDNNSNNNQEETPQENPNPDNKEEEKPKPPKHKWSKWLPLDNEYEHRFRDDGKEEKQKHPSYGEYSDNGNDTKSRTCANCGHTMTIPYIWGDWTAIDDEYEHRFREDGKEETQKHPYEENWKDNGDGTESKTCPNCGNVVTREKHKHHPEKQDPVSLNRTNRDYCKAIYYKCPDDDYIDETKTEYIKHNFPDTPNSVDGNEETYICPDCLMEITKEIEIPPHEHKYVKQDPVSLNRTNRDYCKAIYYKCPDDGEINKDLTEYIKHNFPDTPNSVDDNEETYICPDCLMEITKEITTSNEQEPIVEVPEVEDNITIDFDFDPSSLDNEEFDFIDEDEQNISLEQVDALDNGENIVIEEEHKEEEEKTSDDVLLLEDKHAKPLLEDTQNDLQSVLKTFDTELYKKLFKEKEALEQSLLANSEGIKSEEKLRLIRYIDVIKANMVEELANALVKNDLQKLEEGKAKDLIFKA